MNNINNMNYIDHTVGNTNNCIIIKILNVNPES